MRKKTILFTLLLLFTGVSAGSSMPIGTAAQEVHPANGVDPTYATIKLPKYVLEEPPFHPDFDFSNEPNLPDMNVTESLHEPFFFPYQTESADRTQVLTQLALVAPSGKVMKGYPQISLRTNWGSSRNEYGYFHSFGFFKNSEFVVFDKQGNIRRIAGYDNHFSQLNNQWFIYSFQPGDTRLYNAKTNTWIQLPDDIYIPPGSSNGRETLLDINHLPYYDVKSQKMGLRNLNGTIACKPLFDTYIGYENGIHRVKMNNMTYFINHVGKVLSIPPRNYKVESNMYGTVFVVSGMSQNQIFYSLMDHTGKLVGSKYLYMTPTNDGSFLAVYKDSAGYNVVRVTASGKPAINPIPIQLRNDEEMKEIQFTGGLYHTNSRILFTSTPTNPFHFPHEMLIAPTSETVTLEYYKSGKKQLGVFTHSGKPIYSIAAK